MNTKVELSKGWDENRVQGVAAHYESQTEEQAIAEDEGRTVAMETPAALVPDVKKLLAKHGA